MGIREKMLLKELKYGKSNKKFRVAMGRGRQGGREGEREGGREGEREKLFKIKARACT